MDAEDFINDIQISMKNLDKFEVQVTVPEDFNFRGTVPFDMHIVDKVAFVTVFASSVQEAKRIAEDYFAGGEDNE